MFKRKIRPPIFVAAALTAQTATVERPMRAGLGPAPRRSRAPAGTAASIASISTAEQAVQQQASAREAAFGPVFLGSALMTAQALAGGVFSLTHPSRRTHPRDRWRAAAAEPAGNRLAAEARRDASVGTDANRAHARLAAAGVARVSPPSFARPVRTRSN